MMFGTQKNRSPNMRKGNENPNGKSEIASEFSDPDLHALANSLRFTPDDLAANRRGVLTPAQIRRLQWDQRRQYWPGLIAWAILLALLATITALRVRAEPALIVVPLAGALLAVYAAIDFRSQRQKLQGDDVVGAETFRVDRMWKPRRRFSVVEFQIGPRRFALPRDAVTHLRDGQRYRLYYAREVWSFPVGANRAHLRSPSRLTHVGSYRVLSIEPVGTRVYLEKEKKPKRKPKREE
jgi:hypothetical protein